LYNSDPESLQLITGKNTSFSKTEAYWLFATEHLKGNVSQKGLSELYKKSVQETQLLANRVKSYDS
jgi:hypothetical protein